MSLISPSEMATLQAIGRSAMTSTATILTRITLVTDDGQETAWAQVGEDVPVWVYEITPAGTTLSPIAGAVDLVELFTFRLPVGSPAHSGDQLAIGTKLWIIEHTNDDDTYPNWLICTCRSPVSSR